MFKNTLITLLLTASLTAFSQEFSIDSGHTAVTSKVQRFGMVDVLGRFNDVTGIIIYDQSDITKLQATVTINTSSYSSNNIGGENAVKSQAFLDVNKFPEMTFTSKKVEEQSNQLFMTGDLNLHGVTKEVSFSFTLLEPFKDPTGAMTIAAHATLLINRQDFGITFTKKLPNGKEFIGNEVAIELNVLGVIQ